jgi:hypothetical protein
MRSEPGHPLLLLLLAIGIGAFFNIRVKVPVGFFQKLERRELGSREVVWRFQVGQ